MWRYPGFMCDSQRWQRFSFREDDIVITTPMKSGTTWTSRSSRCRRVIKTHTPLDGIPRHSAVT